MTDPGPLRYLHCPACHRVIAVEVSRGRRRHIEPLSEAVIDCPENADLIQLRIMRHLRLAPGSVVECTTCQVSKKIRKNITPPESGVFVVEEANHV